MDGGNQIRRIVEIHRKEVTCLVNKLTFCMCVWEGLETGGGVINNGESSG